MFIKIAWQILAAGWLLIGFMWWLYSILGENNKKVREKCDKGEQWLHYLIAPFIFIITGPLLPIYFIRKEDKGNPGEQLKWTIVILLAMIGLGFGAKCIVNSHKIFRILLY